MTATSYRDGREMHFDREKYAWIFSDTGEVFAKMGTCDCSCYDDCNLPVQPVEVNLKSGRKDIRYIDNCIAILVEELNKHGIRTHSASCCGHGKENGYIFIDEDSIRDGEFGKMLVIKKKVK